MRSNDQKKITRRKKSEWRVRHSENMNEIYTYYRLSYRDRCLVKLNLTRTRTDRFDGSKIVP